MLSNNIQNQKKWILDPKDVSKNEIINSAEIILLLVLQHEFRSTLFSYMPHLFLIDDGKYLKQIGIGGCRGKNWDKKNCPKFSGRRTLDGCANECRKSDFCTAFHILKPDESQKFDCLLFSHHDVIAVKGLGGVCYSFSDNAPGQDEDEAGIDDIEEEEDTIEFSKLLYMYTASTE